MAKVNIDNSRHSLGVLLILTSALCFSFMSVFVAKSNTLHLFEQTFFRNLIGMMAALALCRAKGVSYYGERRYQPWLWTRSVVGFLAVVSLFYAYRNAAQADVAVVLRTGMFTISLVSVLFLGEKLTKAHFPSMVIAFTGAYIAAQPRFDSSFLPLACAFASALCDTICYPLLSYFSGRVHPLTVFLHFCTFSTVASGVLMLPHFALPTGYELFCLLMIGVFATCGQLCMTYAYHLAPAGELSVYNQAHIVINAAVAFLMLGEAPSLRSVLGGSLVIASSVLLFISKNRQAASQKHAPAGTH